MKPTILVPGDFLPWATNGIPSDVYYISLFAQNSLTATTISSCCGRKKWVEGKKTQLPPSCGYYTNCFHLNSSQSECWHREKLRSREIPLSALSSLPFSTGPQTALPLRPSFTRKGKEQAMSHHQLDTDLHFHLNEKTAEMKVLSISTFLLGINTVSFPHITLLSSCPFTPFEAVFYWYRPFLS